MTSVPGPVHVVTSDEHGVTTLSIHGEFDVAGAPAVAAELRAALDQGSRVVVDLAGVTFLDAAAIGVLVAAHGDARLRGSSVVVTGVTGFALRILRLVGAEFLLADRGGTNVSN